MKNNILILPVLLLLVSSLSSQYRFTPGSDTLLFDGESNANYQALSFSGDCKFKVTYLKGKVIGTSTRKELVAHMCGPGTYEDVTSEHYLENSEEVFSGSVSTGDKSCIELQAPDGSVIRLGPNSSTTLDCNAKFEEDGKKLSVKLVLGTIWSHVTHALGGDNQMEVQTSRAIAGVRGTIFIYETKIENGVYSDKLRTLEGSVDFRGNAENKIDKDELQRQTKILEEDFKAGRITLEEFTRKVKELSDPVINTVDQFHVLVEAGNESVIRGTEPPTNPSKFVETGDEWYLDKNFGK